MKTSTLTLRLGTISARLIRRGDEFPCPSRGHAPFLHERDEPALVLFRKDEILRVVPVTAVPSSDASIFRGRAKRRPWSLTAEQIAKLVRWAHEKYRLAPPSPPTPRVLPKGPPREVTAPKNGYFRRNARTHPFAARDMLEVDYAHKLSPKDQAFLDQFDEETALNRWRDKEGVEPFYPRGSEARRKLQFDYNHRNRYEIYSNPEYWPQSLDTPERLRDARAPALRDGDVNRLRSRIEMMPSSAPTEDDLINAIDRSRE